MLDVLIGSYMVLGIIVAIVLSAMVLIVGGTAVVALFSKIIDIWKGGKSGGRK